MPEYHILRCEVALGGDKDNTVVRGRGNPILFPELLMLQYLHGEDAVTDVAVVGKAVLTIEQARARLDTIYRPDVVKEVYPGARARLPTMDASVPFCDRPVFIPRPVTPDNPDPKVIPLDALSGGTEMGPVIAPEPEPSPDELAAHIEDEHADADPFEDPNEPRAAPTPGIEDQPQTRISFNGQARQARRTEDHLPDVAHARAKPASTRETSPAIARRMR